MSTFVISTGSSTSSTAGGDVPVVGYDNMFRDSGVTVTASGAADGFEAAKSYDWLTNTAWKADASGTAWVKVDYGSGNEHSANYFACYAPDLASNGGNIKLQHSDDDSTWTDATSALAPTSEDPIVWEMFSSVSKRFWRVLVSSTPASQIPVFSAGERMTFDQGLQTGFAPPNLSRDIDIDNIRTDGGAYIARLVRRSGCRVEISTQNNSESWTRNTWLPFVKHAELYPFFFAWQPDGRPSEIALLWTSGSPGPSTYNEIGFHRAGMSCQGICNGL